MGEPQNAEAQVSATNPTQIEVRLGKKVYQVTYVRAFALAYSLLEQGHVEDAAELFGRLTQFTDHGPKALIMQAYCHAAALHFGDCSQPLAQMFNGERQQVATELHNAFVSFHVGIRQDALRTMIDLVNRYPDLPTLCLILGDMFAKSSQGDMARKCWSMAVQRDRRDGAVAAVAAKHLEKSSPRNVK